MKVVFVFILFLFSCADGQSQVRPRQSGSSAHSSLTVTATVAPSVWLVMEPDRKQSIVVANAPDPKEPFSHAATKARRKRATLAKRQNSPNAISQKLLNNQDDAAVRFEFPIASSQFDVTKTTVIMGVSEGGKIVKRPVIVTTVVAQ
jgi:hypothetical protein